MIFLHSQTIGLSNGITTNAAHKLKVRWKSATLNSGLMFNALNQLRTGSLIGVYRTAIKIPAPIILKMVWNKAT